MLEKCWERQKCCIETKMLRKRQKCGKRETEMLHRDKNVEKKTKMWEKRDKNVA